jgi:hypothetical protein
MDYLPLGEKRFRTYARLFKKMIEDFDSNAPSRGLGDTIAKFTKATGIAKVVEVVTETLGIEDCGCGERQEWANNLVPYNQPNHNVHYDPNNTTEVEDGIYEVIYEIHATKEDIKFDYKVGEKVLINENHLLYSDWQFYLLIGAVKKTI